MDLKHLLQIILDNSSITRLNLEMCYPYCAQFKRTPGTGGISQVGAGCFKVEAPLFDPETVKPGDYYYPQEISEELLEQSCVKNTGINHKQILRCSAKTDPSFPLYFKEDVTGAMEAKFLMSTGKTMFR